MTTVQKMIKYFAYLLAAILTFWIFGGIFFVFGIFGSFLYLHEVNETRDFTGIELSYDESNSSNEEQVEIRNLKVSLQASRLALKTEGDQFRIETSSEDRYKFSQQYDKLILVEKDWEWFSLDGIAEVILYIPENVNLNAVDIDLGAGAAYIQRLEANVLDLDLGAGKTTIDELNISERASIDGGVGVIEILNGTVNNLGLRLDVGKAILAVDLRGRNDISGGVGGFELTLPNLEKYSFKVNKGIGSIRIGGQDMADHSTLGSGSNYIDIDGGIGSITVN